MRSLVGLNGQAGQRRVPTLLGQRQLALDGRGRLVQFGRWPALGRDVGQAIWQVEGVHLPDKAQDLDQTGLRLRSGQLSALLAQQQRQPARLVLRTAYQQEGPSQWIAGKTGMPAVLLPYTVGGTPEAKDLFGLFDDTIQRLLKGAR